MAPRGVETEKRNESQPKIPSNNRFLILPEILTNDQNDDRKFIRLRHPQTGDMAIFLYSENDKKIAQMRSLPCSHRSFFKGNKVIPIDRIDFVTLVDPIFLFLPYFVKCSSMFSPLDQILTDEEIPELNNLLMKLTILTDFQKIAIKKECGDLILWQYNESKTLEWLIPKVERLSKVLVSEQIKVNSNAAVSSNFKQSGTAAEHSEDDYKWYSCNTISEYLPTNVQTSLFKHFNLPEKLESNKRKAVDNNLSTSKKVKHSNNTEFDKVMPNKVEKVITPKVNAKEKALKMAAKGSKSISSFFKKM